MKSYIIALDNEISLSLYYYLIKIVSISSPELHSTPLMSICKYITV